MAGCSAVPEISAADNADDRTVRIDIEAVLAHGQAFCKHHGGTCDDIGTCGGDIRDSETRTGDKRIHDIHHPAFRSVYGLSGAAGGIHTGICVHHAFIGVHRSVATRALMRSSRAERRILKKNMYNY